METLEDPEPIAPLHRRSLHVACVAVIGVAIVGYFVGMRPAPRPDLAPASRDAAPRAADAQPSLRYAELRDIRIGPNREHRSALASLVSRPLPDASRNDPAMRRASLADRAKRRAYNGAPPAIPHSTAGMDAPSCLVCHGQGLRVGERAAPRIPHPHYENCLQCHAEMNTSVPGGPGAAPATTFAGIAAPEGGPRAMPGAPPQIPHSTWMRNDCLACHGPAGAAGMQTTHPERSNCKQCHAPSAALEQAAFSGGGPLFLAGGTTERGP